MTTRRDGMTEREVCLLLTVLELEHKNAQLIADAREGETAAAEAGAAESLMYEQGYARGRASAMAWIVNIFQSTING